MSLSLILIPVQNLEAAYAFQIKSFKKETIKEMSATSTTHTVLLVQFTEDENSRTYLDFDTINDALDGLVQIFE